MECTARLSTRLCGESWGATLKTAVQEARKQYAFALEFWCLKICKFKFRLKQNSAKNESKWTLQTSRYICRCCDHRSSPV